MATIPVPESILSAAVLHDAPLSAGSRAASPPGRMLALRPYALLVAAALALATEGLFQPDLLDNFTLGQIARSVGEAFVRNLVLVASMLAVLRWVRRHEASNPLLLMLTIVAAMLTTSVACIFLIGFWIFGPKVTVWSSWAWAQSFTYGAMGSTLALVDTLRIRHLRALAAQRELEVTEDVMLGQLQLAQAQLLEAQIEPHFLFNTIANLRRAWRVDVTVGARMHDNLLRYLKAALPQMRAEHGVLGEEVDLSIAYLELFEVRMGTRLRFEIDAAPVARSQPFPKMMLVTLVENAVKHGLMPSPNGGCVRIEAETTSVELQVRVLDDGVGFGKANTGGTGIGLANIRARLQTQYGRGARLTVSERFGHGVCAEIAIPLRSEMQVAPERAVDDPRQRSNVDTVRVNQFMPEVPSRPHVAQNLRSRAVESRFLRASASASDRNPIPLAVTIRRLVVRTICIWGVFILANSPKVLFGLQTTSWLETLLALLQTQLSSLPIAMIVASQLEVIERAAERSVWLPRAVLLLGLLICAIYSQFPLELLWPEPVSIRTGLVASEVDLKAYMLFQFPVEATFASLYLLSRGRSDESRRRVQAMRSQLLQVRRRMRALCETANAARIDPQLLFDCLTRSRSQYATSPDSAEHRLDGLIGLLRATLGATETAGSTVMREVDLLRHYADAAMDLSTFTVSEEPTPDVARMELAHGLLLPLLQAWAREPERQGAAGIAVKERFELAVWADRTHRPTLFLRLRGPARPIDAAIKGCRDHLDDLYGPEGRLLVSSGPERLEALVTLSLEDHD